MPDSSHAKPIDFVVKSYRRVVPHQRKPNGNFIKLTDDDREEIVNLRSSKRLTLKEISEIFGVKSQRISQILSEDAPHLCGHLRKFKKIPLFLCQCCGKEFLEKENAKDQRFCKMCYGFAKYVVDKKHLYDKMNGIREKLSLKKQQYNNKGGADFARRFFSNWKNPILAAYKFRSKYEKKLAQYNEAKNA